MTDYTPTTEQVRDAYVRGMRDTFIASASEYREEFDRWVQAHDAEVRASVQPPTREQIAEAIKDEMHRLAHEGLVPKPRHAERIADAVRTLFPQPNPVDPDDEFVAPYKVCEECYEECGSRHEHRSGHHDAEPVSIADMAPGTTAAHEFETPSLRGYCPDCGNYGRIHGPVQDVHDGPMRDCHYKGLDMRKRSAESIDAMLRQEPPHKAECSLLFYGFPVKCNCRIDPSTIRDVTPPTATREEGDRG